MFKLRYLSVIGISWFTSYSYAYVIGANLQIDNKTNIPLNITIEQPNGQSSLTLPIPAHQIKDIYLENGDSSGCIYQIAKAPFLIKDAFNDELYAQGRVIFYVGGAYWSKFSFLDSLSVSSGLNLNPTFSCRNGGDGNILQNKIVLEGSPNGPINVKNLEESVICRGFKNSILYDDDIYEIECKDQRKSKFSPGYLLDPYNRRYCAMKNDKFFFKVNCSYKEASKEEKKIIIDKAGALAYCEEREFYNTLID